MLSLTSLFQGRAKEAEEKMLAAQEERRTLLAEKASLLGEVGFEPFYFVSHRFSGGCS